MTLDSDSVHLPPALPVLPVAVRTLAEAVHRQGGLGGPSYASVSGAEGTRLHQKLVRHYIERLGKDAVTAEYRLSGEAACQTVLLQVSGRCDLVVQEGGETILIEAKSFAGSARFLPEQGDSVHWAQAMLYAHLFLLGSGQPEITVGLCYISQETFELIEHRRIKSRQNLHDFFLQTAERFASLASQILSGHKLRDESAKTCPFPFPALRPGQKRLMQEVIGITRQKGVLFAQAPTGTGKTLSVLFPAIRLLSHHQIDRVFYLTAMTSTRKVAEQALQDLRAQGLFLRSLTLRAKEKSCLAPELFCNVRLCPFAIAYYKNLPAALADLLKTGGHCHPEQIRSIAQTHQVCPFELSLDYALYCDVIIGDYNYVFDPRIQLDRFFNNSDQTHLVLVDEAHNLPDRSRGMYSADFDFSLIQEALPVIKDQHPYLAQALMRLDQYRERLAAQILPVPSDAQSPVVTGQSGFAAVEPDQTGRLMQSDQFLAMTQKPVHLLKLLGRIIFLCRQYLEDHADDPDAKKILDLFLAAHFFNKVAELFYGPAYITTAFQEEKATKVRLMCLDASTFLTDVYRDRHPVVFFSATLNPLDYYIGLLDSDGSSSPPEKLSLTSPFPPENFLVLLETRFSTRFQDRTATIVPIVEEILAAARTRIGNYLVFLPSYAYLAKVRQILRMQKDRSDLDFIVQVPGMDEKQKQAFLNRFERYGSKTLVGLAVLGSLFNEGIDLTGERLSGVVIVGVGLPQLSPEREIMSQYFASRLGRGFEYAYQFPGFNKVQQAAGRVIRSESDTGFVLLIDDRYQKPEYRALFPRDWQPAEITDQETMVRMLSEFWSDHRS
ncbi:MAG: helicase C-terminal domain-containing protein [Eubacteriales bacterium]|nr:helicase C-terminal domain-containing protein [Eubacteriales bacterium]